MPRNSSGTYSLYTPGNPVVTSTVISSTWANNTLADLASAMTDSLSRSGDGGMQAPLELTDGAVGAPALTWGSESTSGLFRNAAGDIRMSVLASSVFGFSSQGGLSANGTVGAPAFSFLSDTDSGMYRIGANNIGVGVNGAKVLDIATTGLGVTGTLSATSTFSATTITATTGFRAADGAAATPSFSFTSDTNTGLFSNGADDVRIVAGGTLVAGFLIDGSARPQAYFAAGTGAAPSITFATDSDTGIYRSASDSISIAAGGSVKLAIGTTSLTFGAVTMQGQNGSNSAPFYTFESDPDTGIYRIGTNSLGFAEGGTGYQIGFRQIPRSTTTTTFAIGDVGKCVAVSAAINIPISVFSAGDAISVYNDSSSAVNITISAGTLRLSGTTSTGTRSLAARGTCLLWFNVGGATPEVIASGDVS